MSIEIPKDKWPGAVQTVTLGATAEQGGTRAKVVTIGGEQTLPFMHFENETPHRPVIALEMTSSRPGECFDSLGKPRPLPRRLLDC